MQQFVDDLRGDDVPVETLVGNRVLADLGPRLVALPEDGAAS